MRPSHAPTRVFLFLAGHCACRTVGFSNFKRFGSLPSAGSTRLKASGPEIVPEVVWRRAADEHVARVRRLVGGCLTSYDGDNPIYNFLFRYYFWKPAQLAVYSRKWNLHSTIREPKMMVCPTRQLASTWSSKAQPRKKSTTVTDSGVQGPG